SLHELVFRTIYSCRNAEFQSEARALGTVGQLSKGEAELAAAHNLQPGPVARAWEYWSVRLQKAEAMIGSAPATRRSAPADKKARAPARQKAGKAKARKASKVGQASKARR